MQFAIVHNITVTCCFSYPIIFIFISLAPLELTVYYVVHQKKWDFHQVSLFDLINKYGLYIISPLAYGSLIPQRFYLAIHISITLSSHSLEVYIPLFVVASEALNTPLE